MLLVCGEDEFAVKQRAREVFQQWSQKLGGLDHEMIDASVNNSGEALKALAQLREALQTLPFFGGAKVVWLQNCNFLGEERTASGRGCHRSPGGTGPGTQVLPLGQRAPAGQRRARWTNENPFTKPWKKSARSKIFAGWSENEDAWHEEAAALVRRALRETEQDISEEALAQLVAFVGPQARLLSSEVEKLVLYAGARTRIEAGDVAAIVTRNKQARAFALGDALGDRNLAAVLRCLDQELWEIRRDTKRNEIGLLYGLIGKVRALLMVKEMMAQRLVEAGNRFQPVQRPVGPRAGRRDAGRPEIQSFGDQPVCPVPRAWGSRATTPRPELIEAMDLLLECNQKLISRNLDPSLLLQQTLIQIVSRPGRRAVVRAAA